MGKKSKKKWLPFLLLIFLVGCTSNKTEKTKSSEAPIATTAITNRQKQSETKIINNIIVGRTKFSLNNHRFDQMLVGEFTEQKSWAILKREGDLEGTLQFNIADNTDSVYGDIANYALQGYQWGENEFVSELGVMEEAMQFTEDGQHLMYKGRTGNIIFSLVLFDTGLEQEVLKVLMQELIKEIRLELVDVE